MVLAILFIVLALCLLPGMIANVRHHRYEAPIWVITVLSWFFIGTGFGPFVWTVALLWSVWPQEKHAGS